jgi:uncharacterized protein
MDRDFKECPMKRERVLDILSQHVQEIRDLGVRSLCLFGSTARGESVESSDVDLLVEFLRPVGLFAFVRLQRRLEELIGSRVDLVTPDALKPALREQILKEAVRAA